MSPTQTLTAPPHGLTASRPDRDTAAPWLPELAQWLLPGAFYSLDHTWPAVFRSDGGAEFYALLDGAQMVAFLARRDVVLKGRLPGGQEYTSRCALVGSVATRPEYRGRGLARWLLERACSDARADGCEQSLLWAEQPGLYASCGYIDVGSQDVIALHRGDWRPGEPCEQGLLLTPDAAHQPHGVVRPATVMDRRRLLPLHEAKPWRVSRSEGEMDLHLSTPGAQTYVLDRDGELLAYASIGKGADLAGWWHELGGSDAALTSLLPAAMELLGLEKALLQLPPYRPGLPQRLGGMVMERCVVPVAMQRMFTGVPDPNIFVDGFDSI